MFMLCYSHLFMEELLRTELNCSSIQSTSGGARGCISSGSAFLVDGEKVFVKYNSQDGSKTMFDGEFASLLRISETNTVKVPKPIKAFSRGSESYLVIEYLDMRSLDKYSEELGQRLAHLHLHNLKQKDAAEKNEGFVGKRTDYVDQFGFEDTTCCGFLPQDNGWKDNWVEFYAQNRLLYQVNKLEQNDRDLHSLWPLVERNIPKLFSSDLHIVPALLHGDLWGGNTAETSTGPCIFDAGSSYGHSEFELSISHMFDGFSSEFYTAYHKLIPKAAGFEKRQILYKLYHYLNHWNHFGSGYKGKTISLMKQLASL